MEQQKDNTSRQFTSDGQLTENRQTSVANGRHRSGVNDHGITMHSKPAQGFGYVVRKAEKLTTALYLVTDIMSEKEPMKWKARESAVDLLSDITITPSLSVSEKMTMLRNITKKTEKIIAFLDIAQSAHLMSEMNASVLKREYLVLKDNLDGEWNDVYEKSKSIFSDSFFDVPHESVPGLPKIDTVHTTSVSMTSTEGKQKRLEVISTHPAMSPKNPLPPPASTARIFFNQGSSTKTSPNRPSLPVIAEKKQPLPAQLPSGVGSQTDPIGGMPTHATAPSGRLSIPSIGHADVKIPVTYLPHPVSQGSATQIIKDNGSFLEKRNDVGRDDRRKIVLALIKQKPALTVKDIARSIPHVSEKTIQRELFSMVSEGTLIKRGERRWSTYSLHQQSA